MNCSISLKLSAPLLTAPTSVWKAKQNSGLIKK